MNKLSAPFSFLLAFTFGIIILSSCNKTVLTDEVNVFVGTGGHGHTYPGATAPFGMMQLSPDTREQGWDGCSGYHYSDNFIYGFSHTHLSGTGVGDYADILMLPMSGNSSEEKTDSTGRYGSHFSHEKEFAKPGYYRVFLDDYAVEAELTTTQRCGMHRYTFDNAAQSRILVDLKYRDQVLDSKMEILSDSVIQGYRFSSGWARNQKLFFVIKFNRSFSEVKFVGSDSLDKTTNITKGKDERAFFSFDMKDGDMLLAKVGISAVDEAGALKNLEAEIPGWNFVEIKDAAVSEWEQELSKIEIKTNDVEGKSIFYTSLYHSFLAPNIYSDIDGRYRGRDLKIHNADFDYYTVFSLWDTYRAEHPLFSIIDQKRTVDFIKTFLRQYQEGGLLPIWELSANETFCMIGNHAIPVIADAIANGIEGFDKELAYEAMKASAEQDIPEQNYYRSMGYIPADEIGSSVSKTLELAYDDWCIAKVAQILGKEEEAKKYNLRAQFYKNIFDVSTLKMRPRINGGWKKPFDPREVDFNFTEANSWQYSFYVPQDVENLIKISGGDAAFIQNLDSLFGTSSETTGRKQSDITGLIGQYAHGNEPSHHIAYLYSYAGASWKTQAMAARIQKEMYKDVPDGICGNEDCGQMSAWYVMSSLGFYSVQPASGIYVLGSPKFEEATIHLENKKKFTIKRNGSGDYIQKAKLNGKPYLNSYITFKTIQNGGVLELTMSEKPNKSFGKAKENRPPSFIEPTLIPTPVIVNNKYVFYDSLVIDFKPIEKGKIMYSINDDGFKEFNNPFSIFENSKINYKTVFENKESPTVVSNFYKGETGRSISLMSSYSNQYTGGGDSAIIDFMRGSNNFADGKWQGYEGQNITAIIDLGKIKWLKKVSTGFMQDINSWIWLPQYVEFSFSTDGQHYGNPIRITNPIDPKDEGAIIHEFSSRALIKYARYIKLYAKGMIDCPEWHKGYAYHGKAWMFIDEVSVKENGFPKLPILH